MLRHETEQRVIYGDTDRMGRVYYANYLRWFEIGRTELFRYRGLSYRAIEEKGVFLPVAEVQLKLHAGAEYDDLLIIETCVDPKVKGGIKFDYRILRKADGALIASGYTKHAYLDRQGKVVRPPDFVRRIMGSQEGAQG
ncbi:MAG: thioesterase family protein [Desulfobacterales bacterium]|jgi:acyl-CoA thioester hydrolase